MSKVFDLSVLATRWPSPVVARGEVYKFSGGMLTPKFIANEDSRGTGIKDRFMMGKKVVYPVSSLIAYLQAKVSEPTKGKVGTNVQQARIQS